MVFRILWGMVLSLAICAHAFALGEGKPAPAFSAKLLDGSGVGISDGTGKVIVINFWATWCVPCREEMPALEAYYRKHREEGLQIIAISMDDPADDQKVREVMSAFTFPAAFARDANTKEYGRIWRIPLTFVIDRQGILRKDGWFGDPKIDLPLLEKVVTPLMQQP